MSVVTENRMRLFSKMEERYEKKDSDYFVKLLDHAAIALGVNGSKAATQTLQDALNDPDKPVVESAVVALSNIEFADKLGKNEKFAKLTGS